MNGKKIESYVTKLLKVCVLRGGRKPLQNVSARSLGGRFVPGAVARAGKQSSSELT